MAKNWTIQICTDEADCLRFRRLPGRWRTKAGAMDAAKRAAGENARYWGDGLSIRYAGDNGTAYVVEP